MGIYYEILCNFAFQKTTHQRIPDIDVLDRAIFSIQYQH